MGNLKQTVLQRLKTEESKAEDKMWEKNKTVDHKKQCLATPKRLKRGDDNELRNGEGGC